MDGRNQTAAEEFANHLQVRIFRAFRWRDCDDYLQRDLVSTFSRLLVVERISGPDGGSLRAGSKRLRLLPDHVFLIPAGVRFDLHYRRGLVMYSTFLRLDGPFGEDLLGRIAAIRRRRLDPGVGANLARLAEHRTTIGEALRFRGLLLASLGPLVALGVQDLAKRGRLATRYTGLLAACDRLLPARTSIRLLARQLGENPTNLAKRFRRDVGVTLRSFLQDRLRARLVEALETSDNSIAVIAGRLGFCDQFHCSRCFRRLVGMSPSAFRARLAGDRPAIG